MPVNFIKCNKCHKYSFDPITSTCISCGNKNQKNSSRNIEFYEGQDYLLKNLAHKLNSNMYLLRIFLVIGFCLAFSFLFYLLKIEILYGIVAGVVVGLFIAHFISSYLKLLAQIAFKILNLPSIPHIKNFDNIPTTLTSIEKNSNFIDLKDITTSDKKIITEDFAEKVLGSYATLVEKYEQEKELRLSEKDRVIDEYKRAIRRREEILDEKDKKINELRLKRLKFQI